MTGSVGPRGPLVLASGSPRRRDLLGLLGLSVEVRPADLDESVRPGEAVDDYVRRVASEKAEAVARPGEVVIAADTSVEIDGSILGKPIDDADARTMLRRLSGRTHRVHTAVAVRCDEACAIEVVTTMVHMRTITFDEIDWYLATGEPFDKAGAYALQGAGGVFVAAVEGSVSNVVGLPLATVVDLCARLGVRLLA